MKKKTKIFVLFEENQDAIFQDYLNGVFHGNKKMAHDLHSFFSPYRIPSGLTDEEAQICANLYPLRRAQINRRLKKSRGKGMIAQASHLEKTVSDLELPSELSPRRKMTRARFNRGIFRFLAQLHT